MCMYVYVYMCICVYVYICIYVYVYMYTICVLGMPFSVKLINIVHVISCSTLFCSLYILYYMAKRALKKQQQLYIVVCNYP